MQSSGAMTTCVPVQISGQDWESAMFFQLGGAECKQDRRVLRNNPGPVAIGIETDLIEHGSAAVVVVRCEVHTQPDNPMIGEVLFAPGQGDIHFDVLKNLTKQDRLLWYFSDEAYWVIHSQQMPLMPHQQQGFDDLLRDAIRHDALIRATGRYDAGSALKEVVLHYEPRKAVDST